MRRRDFIGTAALGAAIAAGGLPLRAGASPRGRTFRLDDFFAPRSLSNLCVSPDGRCAIYRLSEQTADWRRIAETYVETHSIRLLDLSANGLDRPLPAIPGDAHDFAFAPDGRRVAFLARYGEHDQIWVNDLDDGAPSPVTTHARTIRQFAWSPDGRRFAFESDVPIETLKMAARASRGSDVPSWLPDEKPVARSTETKHLLESNLRAGLARTTTNMNYHDEFGDWKDISLSQIHVCDATEGASEHALVSGFSSGRDAAWMPDGEDIVFAGIMHFDRDPDWSIYDPQAPLESRLFSVHAQSGRWREICHEAGVSLFQPVISPDGSSIAFTAERIRPTGAAHILPDEENFLIGVTTSNSGTIEWITRDLDRPAHWPFWIGKGDLLFVVLDRGLFGLRRHAGGAIAACSPDGVDIPFDYASRRQRPFAVIRDGIVSIAATVERPSEIVSFPLAGNRYRHLTQHNRALDEIKRSEPVRATVTSEGFPVDYWVFPPTGLKPGHSYPLIVRLHGGPDYPVSNLFADRFTQIAHFNSRGYGVMFMNYRGSLGYGQRWLDSNRGRMAEAMSRDVIATVDDAVRSFPWIDGERLLLTGASAGGLIGPHVIARTDRFKALICGFPALAPETGFGESYIWRWALMSTDTVPWAANGPQRFQGGNVLYKLGGIKTPTLILYGSIDYNVGPSAARSLYRWMKYAGIEAELVEYGDCGHWDCRTVQRTAAVRLDYILRSEAFFEKYVSPGPKPNGSAPPANARISN